MIFGMRERNDAKVKLFFVIAMNFIEVGPIVISVLYRWGKGEYGAEGG